MLDRSDDPLGIVALAVLIIVVARDRHHFTGKLRMPWLVTAMGMVAAAVLGAPVLPALARGVMAVLAVCVAMLAVRGRGQPVLALTGLGLLSLPLLSSLQFFAGYPLRLIAAEAARLLLIAAGFDVERSGSALVIDGQLVMVDAPCSGVHMAWIAYFTAFAASAWLRVPDTRVLRLLPVAGLSVLLGNIVRNTLLVVKEAGLVSWPEWSHDAIGLAVFAAVCVLVLVSVHYAARQAVPLSKPFRAADEHISTPVGRWSHVVALVVYAGLFGYPFLQSQAVEASPRSMAIEWPRQYEGQALRPLALSAVEQRFADRFPGAIGRFADGRGTLVLRHVAAPTRMLHPAGDCYRGLGYRVSADALERLVIAGVGSGASLQRCFVAERNGHRLRVCEHIVDSTGQVYSDTSAWYWAAVTGRSQGPWQAITRARPL